MTERTSLARVRADLSLQNKLARRLAFGLAVLHHVRGSPKTRLHFSWSGFAVAAFTAAPASRLAQLASTAVERTLVLIDVELFFLLQHQLLDLFQEPFVRAHSCSHFVGAVVAQANGELELGRLPALL